MHGGAALALALESMPLAIIDAKAALQFYGQRQGLLRPALVGRRYR